MNSLKEINEIKDELIGAQSELCHKEKVISNLRDQIRDHLQTNNQLSSKINLLKEENKKRIKEMETEIQVLKENQIDQKQV